MTGTEERAAREMLLLLDIGMDYDGAIESVKRDFNLDCHSVSIVLREIQTMISVRKAMRGGS